MNNAIKAKGHCDHARAVMLYADGELDATPSLQFESHLPRCCSCRDELELVRAMRQSLRRSASRCAPAAVEERLRLVVEHAMESDGHAVAPAQLAGAVEGRPVLRERAKATMASRARWAGFAAVAAAACVAVGFFGQRAQQDERMSGQVTRTPLDGLMKSFGGTQAAVATTATASSSSQPVSLDAMLDQLVAWHADPFPPEARSTDELLRFEPHVGVPVKRSALKLLAAPSGKRARFNGARMMPVRDGSARATAALQYTIQGHRMTVYVFDSRAMPLRLTRLKERRVQEKPVYVGNVRGYSVAAAEQGGVGYALASDLDDDRSVQMVASF